jgi:hypothetical protein
LESKFLRSPHVTNGIVESASSCTQATLMYRLGTMGDPARRIFSPYTYALSLRPTGPAPFAQGRGQRAIRCCRMVLKLTGGPPVRTH